MLKRLPCHRFVLCVQINEAIELLKAGKPRYRIVLAAEI